MTRPTGPADPDPTEPDPTEPTEEVSEPSSTTDPVEEHPDDVPPPQGPGKQQDPLRGGFTKPV